MLRRIGLALIILVSVLATLPLATSLAHNLRFQPAPAYHHRARRSRAWWRRHRAKVRRRLAMIARRRALLAAQNGRVLPPAAEAKSAGNHVALPAALAFPENFYRDGSLALPVPTGWAPAANSKASSVFRIAAPDGMPGGNATLSVVAVVSAKNVTQPIGREQRKVLGGVSFTDLRRTVIDRMISAGGWVVNDREREIGGHRVFHVIAQTPATTAGAPEQIWNFYFTEMNGRVYSLTTRTGGNLSDRLTADAEKFLSSFNPMTPSSAIKK